MIPTGLHLPPSSPPPALPLPAHADYTQALRDLWKGNTRDADAAQAPLDQTVLQGITLGSAFAFAVTDCVEGSWVYVSDNFERVTSYPKADVLAEGRNFVPARTFHDDAVQLIQHLPLLHTRTGQLAQQGATDFHINFCYRIYRADGSLMWLHEQMIPLKCSSGQIEICLGIVHDITALKADTVLRISGQALLGAERIHYYSHSSNAGLLDQFTDRELETLRLLAQGNTSKEAAQIMGIEASTAVTYRKSLLRKTACSNVAELLQLAYRQALL